MLRRLLLVAFVSSLTLITPALIAPEAEAGIYAVQACQNGDRSGNQDAMSWFSTGNGAPDIWSRPYGTGCLASAGLIQTWNGADAPQGAYASYSMTAPAGTSFTSGSWQQLIQIQGGGARCVYGADGAGNVLGSTQTCLANSFGIIDSGWEQKSFTGDTTTFQLITGCVFGPCNGGGSSQMTSEFSNISINITDNTNPALSNGSGIWSEAGWVRGSWPLGWTGSDSMGIKTHRYFIDDVAQDATLVCNPSFTIFGIFFGTTTVACPSTTSSNAAYTVNTTSFSDAAHTLKLSSYDATSDGTTNQGTASTTIYTDNSAPGTPTISGASKTNNPTPTFTFSASDAESGISGYECSLNGGAYFACSSPYTTPTQTPGTNDFSVRALNNAKDSSGVVATGSPGTLAYILDTTPPNAIFTNTPTNPTKANPLTYTLNFDKDISGLDASDFTVQGTASGCSASTSGSSGTTFTISLSGCSEGTAGITLLANSVSDEFGNVGPTSDLVSAPVTIDRTKPTAYWTEPPSPTTDTTLEYTLVFSELVSGISASDFQNNGSSTGCIFTPSSTTGTAITVTVSSCSEGTVIAQLNANSVTDSIGNIGPSTPRIASPVVIDLSGPVGSWTEPSSPTKATTLSYTLTTNETAYGMSDSAIEVSGTASGCSASVSGSSGTSFPVTVSGCSEGTVILTLKANSLTDSLGNTGPATDNVASTVVVDRTPATASWTAPSSPTNANDLVYTLNFDKPISGLSSGDFVITGTASGCLPSRDASSGTSFTITVSGCSQGTVTITLLDDSVIDDAGNLSPATNTSANQVTIERTPATASWVEPSSPTNSADLSYGLTFSDNISGLSSADFSFTGTASGCVATPDASTGASFTITVSGCSEGTVILTLEKETVTDDAGNASPASNQSASSVTVDRTPASAAWTEPASPTNASNLSYTLTFDKNISGLTSSDFSFTGTATGCAATPDASSGTTFTITVSSCSEGTVIIALDADSVQDNAGNSSPASSESASAVTVDRTPASAAWTEPSSPTDASNLSYTLTFDKNISGLTGGDFSFTGTATGCLATPDASSGTSFTITVSSCSEGTVILTLDANSVQDNAGNSSPASSESASAVTIDRTPASAAWTEPASPTNASDLSYTLTFNKNVSGLTGGDFSFTGTASGCVATPDASSGTTFTITVSSCSEGTVIIALAQDSVQDDAGNPAPTSDQSASTVTIDRSPPTLSWTEPASPTNSTDLSYTINFDSNVTGLDSGDFANQGTATGCLFAVTGSGQNYTITVSGCSEGTVIVRLAADSVQDAAGNSGPASASDASSVTVDRTPATVNWTAPPSPQTSLPIDYTLTFDKNISGLSGDDFVNTGSAEGCLFTPSASSGTTFTITISGCKAGTIIPRLNQETVEDNAGNKSPASNSNGSAVDYQTRPEIKTAPTIIGDPVAGQTLTANEGQWYGTEPITFSYQWLRCLAADPNNCVNIGSGKTHTLDGGDVGFVIRVEVTASNGLGSDNSRTGPSGVITLPAPQITKSPANPASSGDIEWTSIAGSESLCSVNGGSFNPCTSPFSIDGYPEGNFTFSVKQKKGGQESAAASVSFRIDRTPPAAPTISEYPANPTQQTSAPFRFFGENEASFQCKWDNGDWAACASPETRSELTLGDHTFSVRQIDAAGNISPGASYAWKIVSYDPNVMGNKIEMGSNKYDPVSGRSPEKAIMTCGVNRGTFTICEVFTFAIIKKVSYKKTKKCKKKANRKKSSCKKTTYKYLSVGKGKVINKNNLGGVEIKINLNRSGQRLLSKSRGPLKVRTNYRVTLPNGKKLRAYKISYLMPPTQKVTILYGRRIYQSKGSLTPYGRSYIKKVTANMPRSLRTATCYGYSSSRNRSYSYRIARTRAQSICDYMRQLGIKARYKVVSYGNSKPRRSNKSKTGRALNNRTVIEVRYK